MTVERDHVVHWPPAGWARAFSPSKIGARLSISIKTIETYRENIKTKLKIANGTELARYAVQWVLEQS